MTALQPVAPGRLHLLLAEQPPLATRAQHMPPGWLGASEQARLAALQHPGRRTEFLACRYALRQLLAAGCGAPIDHWRLDAPEGSAPRLDAQHHGAEAARSTHLSLSHSGGWLACAVAPHPVGIDIEVRDLRTTRRRRDPLALATMACTPGETAQLQALHDEAARQRHFLQLWSLKEAYFKCVGTGVDFSVVRRIECRPAGAESSGRVLAHARAWQGTTGQGLDVLLSVCITGRGGTPRGELPADAAVTWRSEEEWRLVALP